jgi:hypothetical protein
MRRRHFITLLGVAIGTSSCFRMQARSLLWSRRRGSGVAARGARAAAGAADGSVGHVNVTAAPCLVRRGVIHPRAIFAVMHSDVLAGSGCPWPSHTVTHFAE